MTFQPRINSDDFQCFFAAGSGWGLYRQNRKNGLITSKLECRHGKLVLRQLVLGNETTNRSGAKATVTGPGGVSVPCAVKAQVDGVQVAFSADLTIREGEMAALTMNE
jgi:hypothetical protein